MRSMFVLSSIVLMTTLGSASATTFTGSAVGSWGTPTGTAQGDVYTVTNHDVGGVASFDFGVADTGSFDNLFTFNGVGSDGAAGFSANPEQIFDVGHFTYANGSTFNWSQYTSIGLSIDLIIAGVGPITFTYDFAIDATPNNTGNPILDGDIVTITDGITSTNFVYNGVSYTLALDGFSTDGGTTITSQFLSPEGSTADADIYATITSHVAAVPEPGSLALFGAAVLGLGFVSRGRARI